MLESGAEWFCPRELEKVNNNNRMQISDVLRNDGMKE